MAKDHSFLTDVSGAFASLLDRGLFVVSSISQDDRFFGNAQVVLSANAFLVRLSTDRGDCMAHVRSHEKKHWTQLALVLRACGANDAEISTLSPAQAASLIEAHYDAIDSAFSPMNFAATMKKLEIVRQGARRVAADNLRLRNVQPPE